MCDCGKVSMIEVSGVSYCQDCFDMDCISCQDCGVVIAIGNEKHGSDGNDYCDSCFEKNFNKCANCGKLVANEDVMGGGEDNYCEDCYTELFTCCNGCSDSVANDDTLEGSDGNFYCQSCWDERFIACTACGDTVKQSYAYSNHRGDAFCENCYYDRYTSCDNCGSEIYRDDAINTNDGTYCEDCAPNGRDFEPAGFTNKNGHFGSARKFGIELETSACDDYSDMSGSKAWGAKDDCSVDGKEFYSDILDGNDGLAAIDEICTFARRNRWKVDRRCGYHLHLDMRGEKKQALIAIAAAYRLTYEVWCDFVDSNRVSNNYCHASEWTVGDLMTYTADHKFSEFATRYYRYQWLNIMAYGTHKTFEIRLHHGTLDANAIKMWVKAHTTFADYAAKHTPAEMMELFNGVDHFDKICAIWTAAGCADVAEYYKKAVPV